MSLRWFNKIRAWLRVSGNGTTVRPRRVEPPRPPRARPWTAEGSKTEAAILAVLGYAHAPMTRKEISERLDVQTAGLVLPRMVERGLVRVLPQTWPYQYALADAPIVTAPDAELSAEDRLKQRFNRVM